MAKERVQDEPSKEDFATQGDMFFKEFRDVVMLRNVHRTYDDRDERVKKMPTAEERKQFLEESDKFQGVLERMSDLSWSAEDHAWLSQRPERAGAHRGGTSRVGGFRRQCCLDGYENR